MKHLWLLAICLLLGCAHRADSPPQPPSIRVGDSMAGAIGRLEEVGAKDISKTVGLLRGRSGVASRWLWYELPDGTCVNLFCTGPDAHSLNVEEIEVGENGAGYGGKDKWLASRRQTVERLPLR